MAQNLSPTARKLMTNLCLAAGKVKSSGEAKSNLVEQMHRVKEVSSRGVRNRDLEREFYELEVKIKEALDKEVVMSRRQVNDERLVQDLKDRIERLEKKRADFEKSHILSIQSTNHKLEHLTKSIKELHTAISISRKTDSIGDELKKNIESDTQFRDEVRSRIKTSKKEIKLLEGRINSLAKKHNQLKKKNVEKEVLDVIKKRLDSLIGRVDELKKNL